MCHKPLHDNKDKVEPSPDKAATILTIRNLEFGYKPHMPVLKGINLDVPKGRFLGLLGPSGSGKSTLLKLLIGLHKPWHGYIKFGSGNRNYNRTGDSTLTSLISSLVNPMKNFMITPCSLIGYVPQIESVDWNFPVTVTEVVGMGIWNRSGIYPWFNKKTKEKIKHMLSSLDIAEYAKRQIRELSGGEQQRVFLARALIGNPQILILDEPTSGVDYNTREKILGILTDLNLKGMTIILTTHDVTGLGKRLPWVVCINKRLISQGPPNEALTSDNLLKTYGLAVDVNNLVVNDDELSISRFVDSHSSWPYNNRAPE
jgi:ABC-type Mn2+/Zn2+ transport system ATPase subunit